MGTERLVDVSGTRECRRKVGVNGQEPGKQGDNDGQRAPNEVIAQELGASSRVKRCYSKVPASSVYCVGLIENTTNSP